MARAPMKAAQSKQSFDEQLAASRHQARLPDALHLSIRDWVASEIAGIAAAPLPRVDNAAKLVWLGVDTIAQHRIAIAAEDMFGIEIGAAEMELLVTVGDVVALIERKRTGLAA